MLVGLSGDQRSGKTTVAEALVNGYGFTRLSFADPMRRDLLVLDPYIPTLSRPARLSAIVGLHGWTEAKEQFPEVRRLLQVYGTDVHRAIDPEVWVERMFKLLNDTDDDVVIDDVRFPNEAHLVDSMGGFMFRLVRQGSTRTDHASDTALDMYPGMFTVANNDRPIDAAEQIVELVQ